MIKLERVNKYFNRRKKNEIHVINNTSLEMEPKGLIALLGPSGCGKTTLLNVIGGLDKVNSGQVYINGQKITGKTAGRVDKIRNLNVGYIFQNYNLLDNMTVFDNVAIALKMVGVKDKKEIAEKVNYVLEQVGMYRYRNRYADMLSGGERQRVGIARAIVKNPAIVIADEPTGNLDSRNTLEVMNIIKAISKDRLVILVTHEEELADFYASRIIRILDGKVVSDVLNDQTGDLDYRIDNKIYLKDVPDHKRLKTENYHIDFYNESSSPVNLDIVVKNGNIYIKTKNDTDRIEIVDENSSIEMVDDHYRQMTQEESGQASGFDLQKLETSAKRKYKSILNPWTLLKKGFCTVRDYHVIKKILLAGFLIAAMFITYSICNIFGVLHVTDDEFVEANKNYIQVVGKKIDVKTYRAYEKDEAYEYIMPGDSGINLTLQPQNYFQTRYASVQFSGSLSDYGQLQASDLCAGRLPENDQEIVIDRMILDNAIKDQGTKMLGYAAPADFLEEKIDVTNMPKLEIVGISDCQSPCIYADQGIFVNLLVNAQESSEEGLQEDGEGDDGEGAAPALLDYKLKKKDITLEKGDWPKKKYEVLVNEMNKEEMKIGKEISTKVNGKKLKVVGYYSDPKDSNDLLVSNTTVKYNLIQSSANITLSPKDKKAALTALRENKVNVKDTYADSEKQYRKEIRSSVMSALILAAVILAISFIEIFLIIRASFLSRVKEVGIYRAIGVKKIDIYKMFMGEILAITTMASLPGFLFMSYILYQLSGISYFSNMYMVNPAILGIALILIYGLNLVFGLFPVFRTIRKRPAAILSRTDIS